MRGSRFQLTLAIALAVLAVSSAARAEPSAAEKETARQALAEGKRKLAAGDAAGALASLEAAYTLVPVPTTGVALAHAQEANGLLVEARDTALTAAAMATEGNEAFEHAAAEAAELAKSLAPRVPSIRLRITPEDAEVRLDGKAVALAARAEPLRANPGAHQVRISAPGYASTDRSFTLGEGSVAQVVVALVPGTADAAPGASASSAVPLWVWVTGGVGVALAGVAIGARVDEATIEAKIRDKCNGDVLHGCPPRSVYDPAPDDSHKHVDFDVFLTATIAGGAALSAAVIGFVASRGRTAAPPATGRLRIDPFFAPGRDPSLGVRGVF